MKLTVTLEVEVEGTETESEARATAVGLVTPLLSEKKKGRPASGPRATVVGFHVNTPSPVSPMGYGVPASAHADVME